MGLADTGGARSGSGKHRQTSPWDDEEISALVTAVQIYPASAGLDRNVRWKKIAAMVGNERSKRECYDQYRRMTKVGGSVGRSVGAWVRWVRGRGGRSPTTLTTSWHELTRILQPLARSPTARTTIHHTQEGKSNEGGVVSPDGREGDTAIDFGGDGGNEKEGKEGTNAEKGGRGSRRRTNSEGDNSKETDPATNNPEGGGLVKAEKEEKKKRSLFGGSRRKAKEESSQASQAKGGATGTEEANTEPTETEVG